MRSEHFPRPGETISGSDFQQIPGGKGANQAVAAARWGGHVKMVGRVGEDAFARSLREGLRDAGVDVEAVESTSGSSGAAVISVDSQGENAITVVPGANGRLTAEDVERCAGAIAAADALLVQLETPVEAVVRAVELAKSHGVLTVLDPAPAPTSPLPRELMSVDILTPNQTEAAALCGVSAADPLAAAGVTERLRALGARRVALKMGRHGAYFDDGDLSFYSPAYDVDVVDTTAAGDAFSAALAVGFASQLGSVPSIRLACAAGSLAASHRGAQPAMPCREDAQRLCQEQEVVWIDEPTVGMLGDIRVGVGSVVREAEYEVEGRAMRGPACFIAPETGGDQLVGSGSRFALDADQWRVAVVEPPRDGRPGSATFQRVRSSQPVKSR